jgi:hypothetical protein
MRVVIFVKIYCEISNIKKTSTCFLFSALSLPSLFLSSFACLLSADIGRWCCSKTEKN